MFHGRKRQDKKALSQEELHEIEAKLEKVVKNNQILLGKRANKEFSLETLKQTEKFSYLSPDMTTLWNYRREILSHLFENEIKED